MSHVIRIVGFANGVSCLDPGEYLETMDFEAHGGRGRFTTTKDIAKAKQFPDALSALMFSRTQSKTHPLRSDGKPNRPLSGIDMVIEEMTNDGDGSN